MSILTPYRQEIRAQLDANCLLRRDQAARALFICDYPRRGRNAKEIRKKLCALDYIIEETHGMWLIDLSPARYERDLKPFTPEPNAPLSPRMRALCRSLRAGETPPVSLQPPALLRRAFIYIDENAYDRLYHELSTVVAVLKRTHAPLPAAAANLIEAFCKEDSPC